MGADCCGTPEPQQNGAPHNMQNGTNLITSEAPAPVPGKTKPAAHSARPHKDYVQKREPYYQKRVDLFQQYHQRQVDQVAAAKEANKPIKVSLPDGSTQPGVAGVTTPMDIAKTLPKSVQKKAVIAKVKSGEAAAAGTWDLLRPLETDCSLELFSFEDKIGKDVRHLHLPAHCWQSLANCYQPATTAELTTCTNPACRPSGIPALTFWDKLWSWSLVLI